MTRTLPALVVGILLASGPVAAADQDSLSAARDLYSSAAYEDALSLLNRLRSADVNADERSSVERYRALCLLALGRDAEAKGAIEAVVTADPLYRPSDSDVSPRVRTAFSDVRRRLLPGIIQRWYAQAKAAFDKKDYVTANDGFLQLVKVFADADVGTADETPMSDLRTLAVGFQELSAKAIPAPAPVLVTPATPPPPPPPAAPVAPQPPRIFSTTDANVVPPSTIRQDLPPYTMRGLTPVQGTIEIVIDETGAAESVIVRQSTGRSYDALVLQAARKWRYTPATLDGAPVKFRKLVGISISAAR